MRAARERHSLGGFQEPTATIRECPEVHVYTSPLSVASPTSRGDLVFLGSARLGVAPSSRHDSRANGSTREDCTRGTRLWVKPRPTAHRCDRNRALEKQRTQETQKTASSLGHLAHLGETRFGARRVPSCRVLFSEIVLGIGRLKSY